MQSFSIFFGHIAQCATTRHPFGASIVNAILRLLFFKFQIPNFNLDFSYLFDYLRTKCFEIKLCFQFSLKITLLRNHHFHFFFTIQFSMFFEVIRSMTKFKNLASAERQWVPRRRNEERSDRSLNFWIILTWSYQTNFTRVIKQFQFRHRSIKILNILLLKRRKKR